MFTYKKQKNNPAKKMAKRYFIEEETQIDKGKKLNVIDNKGNAN